jgi:hypothetical protein
MPDETPVPTHPVQVRHLIARDRPRVPKVVSLRAYEVYSAVFRPQDEIITGDCRGGFGVSELIGFLYARSFPKEEWDDRFHEALRGMEAL